MDDIVTHKSSTTFPAYLTLYVVIVIL